MAKVSFSKLGLKVNQDVKNIIFNDQTIEVKQYLPINDKLELIGNVINLSADDNNFANPMKVDLFTTLEIIYAYTNINFTDKQKEDFLKLYDSILSSELADMIFDAIPEGEMNQLLIAIEKSVKAVYDYKNSALGIMESISADYSNLNLDATAIQEKLADPDNMNFLKDVMTKLG